MRSKTNILAWFLAMTAMIAMNFAATSCSPEGLIDESEFSLYYPGVSDIGISAETNISIEPTYHGSKPSDFQITKVTFEGKNVTSESFTIDSANGKIEINDTHELSVGTYLISVSCISGGKKWTLNDIVTVNVLKKIPDGIKMEPSEISATIDEIKDITTKLQTSKVTTEKNHISITSFSISSVIKDHKTFTNADKYFQISDKGVFSIIKDENSDIEPGVYIFNFKLNTTIVDNDSSEGLFENALKVTIDSKPMGLKYPLAKGLVKAGAAFHSPAPILKGSPKGAIYSITSKKDRPECPGLVIDEKTGILSLPEGHSLKSGERYEVGVTVKNDFGSATFEEATYNLEVVEELEAISDFSYADLERVVECSIQNTAASVKGDNILFELAPDNTALILRELDIDPETGIISAPHGHSIPIGEYDVKTIASNPLGKQEASFKLKIKENMNQFTYVCWGNNLGLEPAENYASQFRLYKDTNEEKGQFNSVTCKIVATDMTEEQRSRAKYSLQKTEIKSMNIGEIQSDGSFTAQYHKKRKVNYLTVTVTVGEGEEKIEKHFPVFFDNVFGESSVGNKKIDMTTDIAYTPFAICVNPIKGGKSGKPAVINIDGREEKNLLLSIDFRRTFSYTNYDGPESHVSGQLTNDSHNFLNRLWDQSGEVGEYGTRRPVSFNENKEDLSKPLLYIDGDDCVLHVNPGKFVVDHTGANGVFMGQAPFVLKDKRVDPNDYDKTEAHKIFPIAVWFDKRF